METSPIALEQLNTCSDEDFISILGPVFENAPWVCEAARQERPFSSLTTLHASLIKKLSPLTEEQLLSFLRGHARLSSETLRRGTTPESTHEQKSVGLDQLEDAIAAQIDRWNLDYETRFGFPFILAVRNASLTTLLASFERRLHSSPDMERREAIAEITAISWMRLLDRVQPVKTGGLSTHVLDTVRTKPAAGLKVELWQVSEAEPNRLLSSLTDEGGRIDFEESEDVAITAGRYEWRFDTSSYFAEHGYSTLSRAYLGSVTVGFCVWNPEEHYHVPLLLNPGAYTTYRGN